MSDVSSPPGESVTRVRAACSSPWVGKRRPGPCGVPTVRHSYTADPYAAGRCAVSSTHVPAIGKVSNGHLTKSACVASSDRRSASAARGTRPSRDSRTSTLVAELRLSLLPGIERCLMSLPSNLTAAYDEPPSAMNTAGGDITLA